MGIWEAVQEAYANQDWEKIIELLKDQDPTDITNYNLAVAYYHLHQYDKTKHYLENIHRPDKYAKRLYYLAISHNKKPVEKKEKMRDVFTKDGEIVSLKFFKSNVKFKDVIGQEKAKRWLRENIINAILYPELFRKYKKKLTSAVIFYGPAGVGKTLLAKAVAGETNANFLSIDVKRVLNLYVGTSEKNLHKIFELARKNAPCILFLDEFDNLGMKRSSDSDSIGESSVMRGVSNTLLTELDGIETNNENVYLLAATNRPWDIDSALKRSGRFNNLIYLTYPSLKEREAMLKLLLPPGINILKIALRTAGYSYADIAQICDQARLLPINDELHSNKESALTTEHIMKTIKKLDLDEKTKAWYIDAQKELLGHMSVDIIDGKPHYHWQSGKLDTQEKAIYKPLLKDIKKYVNGSKAIALQRFLSKIL
ncbi:MAG: ATP-binding protein [Candidatus Micrarchaeaceae archaeon]